MSDSVKVSLILKTYDKYPSSVFVVYLQEVCILGENVCIAHCLQFQRKSYFIFLIQTFTNNTFYVLIGGFNMRNDELVKLLVIFFVVANVTMPLALTII